MYLDELKLSCCLLDVESYCGTYSDLMSTRHHALQGVHAVASRRRHHGSVVYPGVLPLPAETTWQRHASLKLNVIQFRQLNRALRVNDRRFLHHPTKLSFLNDERLVSTSLKKLMFFSDLFDLKKRA